MSRRNSSTLHARHPPGLQDAYLELVGDLETTKILSNERAMRALQEPSGDHPRRLYSHSEVEGMIPEEEDAEGEQP